MYLRFFFTMLASLFKCCTAIEKNQETVSVIISGMNLKVLLHAWRHSVFSPSEVDATKYLKVPFQIFFQNGEASHS